MNATKPLSTETHYEVLRVDRNATITEIVAAYHAAKNAFSGDSVATYSLFTTAEISQVLQRLEEAYLTLSNIEKKREYDHWLSRADGSAPPAEPQAPARPQLVRASTPSETSLSTDAIQAPLTVLSDTPVTGSLLAKIRESRGLSVQDVARITKISVKFIEAIESDEPSALPARVYLQGFIKNLATLYHLDPAHAVQSYLSRFADLPPTP